MIFIKSIRKRNCRFNKRNRNSCKKIGVSDEVKGGGYRSLVNVGENGGQEVPHLHFHIFGGEKVGKMVS